MLSCLFYVVLFLRFIGTSRVIVSDIAGTTRDSIDAEIVRGNERYRIIDTAGIRIKKNVEEVRTGICHVVL